MKKNFIYLLVTVFFIFGFKEIDNNKNFKEQNVKLFKISEQISKKNIQPPNYYSGTKQHWGTYTLKITNPAYSVVNKTIATFDFGFNLDHLGRIINFEMTWPFPGYEVNIMNVQFDNNEVYMYFEYKGVPFGSNEFVWTTGTAHIPTSQLPTVTGGGGGSGGVIPINQ